MLFKSLYGKYRLPSILLTFVVGVALIYVGVFCLDLLPRVGLFILLFGVVFLVIGGLQLMFYFLLPHKFFEEKIVAFKNLNGKYMLISFLLFIIIAIALIYVSKVYIPFFHPFLRLFTLITGVVSLIIGGIILLYYAYDNMFIDDWWKKVIWSREDSALALLREGKVSKKAVRVLVKVLTDKKPRPRHSFCVSRKDAAEALATTDWQPKRHLESLHYFATQKNWGKLIEARNSAIPVLLLIIEECRESVKGFSSSDIWGPTSEIKEELIEATKILLNIGDPRSLPILINLYASITSHPDRSIYDAYGAYGPIIEHGILKMGEKAIPYVRNELLKLLSWGGGEDSMRLSALLLELGDLKLVPIEHLLRRASSKVPENWWEKQIAESLLRRTKNIKSILSALVKDDNVSPEIRKIANNFLKSMT